MYTKKLFLLNSLIKYTILSVFFACSDNGPDFIDFPNEKISFSYAVNGDFAEDFYIGSEIQFTNNSAISGSFKWDFGDGSTSTEVNPIHKYETANTYKVTLSIDGEGSYTSSLLISDIFPIITITCTDPICEVNESSISLSIFLPNPESLDVSYQWTFPEGTTDNLGNSITSYDGENPGNLSFSNVGSQSIFLKTKLGGRSLEEGKVNVQVGYSQEVKTLYYAVKDGNLMAYKIVNSADPSLKIAAFDLGVKSGNHPMNLLCDDSLLYVLDAGKQFNYINDEDGVLGDGKISVISKDGSIVETLITNNGGTAFDDPFYGYLDLTNKLIYVSDRNTGIMRLPMDSRNLQMDRNKYSYYVQNEKLKYYNADYGYGAMNACMTRVNDIWYWAKTYNNAGIFRFKESDIQTESVTSGVKNDPYPVILAGCFIKSFVIDAERNLAYFIVRSGVTPGLYATTFDSFNTIKSGDELNASIKDGSSVLVAGFESDDLGSSGEYIDVCQMALDKETGIIYFGLRASANSELPSGLYKCQMKDPGILVQTNFLLESLVKDVLVYGITINNKKSKLF